LERTETLGFAAALCVFHTIVIDICNRHEVCFFEVEKGFFKYRSHEFQVCVGNINYKN